MPHIDRPLRLLLLNGLSLASPLAHALCQPMAASAQRETVVAQVRLDETATLLALDGSRIKTWEPPVAVETGTRATPVIWAERVDWSVYLIDPMAAPSAASKPASTGALTGGSKAVANPNVNNNATLGPTVLRFERGPDGVRHLCGIAQFDAGTLLAAQAAGRPGLPKPDYETRFQYDRAGRLAGYETRSQNAQGKPNPSANFCLRYDSNGWLAEHGANACSDPSRPLMRYVHDAAGRLLRTISYVENQGDAQEVTQFDHQGQPAQRYRRQRLDWSNEKLMLGLPYQERPSEFAVLVLPGANWAAPAMESYHYDWAIVQPKGKDGDVYGARRDPSSILAQGNSGPDGQFPLSVAQRRQVWEAAGKNPGAVHWLWAPGQVYTLLQTLPPGVWEACTNAGNRQADACGAP